MISTCHPSSSGHVMPSRQLASARDVPLSEGISLSGCPVAGTATCCRRSCTTGMTSGAASFSRNCHDAMNRGDRLLVVETVLTSDGEAPFAALSDLHMLVVAGGRERTEEEYRALLARAGYEVTRVAATGAPQSIIEAHRI